MNNVDADIADFSIVYKILYPQVCRYCKYILKDDYSDISSDIASESIVKCLEQINRFRNIDHIKGFLLQTARNKCYDFLNKKTTSRKYLKSIEYDCAYDQHADIENDSYRRTLINKIILCSSKFSSQLKKVFDLYWINDLPVNEIERLTGITTSTIHSHSSIAIKKLKEKIKHD